MDALEVVVGGTVAIPFSSGLCSFAGLHDHAAGTTSQSLFHQVCVRSQKAEKIIYLRVAIPFSSGLCSFLAEEAEKRGITLVAIPFSSGLCSFTPRLTQVAGCVPSQSLFHQVCVRSAI